MVRPHSFSPNLETAADNAFQSTDQRRPEQVSAAAVMEFDEAVRQLGTSGVEVHVFDQLADQDTPDCVFPNNWFSTHAGGHIAIYPMFASSRKRERRWDIVEMLKSRYRVQDVIDYSGLETDDLALEGTGAMVLDHVGRVAYTAQSNRADPVILERFCTNFNFEPMVFQARDRSGSAIYHTNVMMTVGTDFALVCLDMIVDSKRRAEVVRRLEESGRDVVALSHEQIAGFAGNALELKGRDGLVLALSARAEQSLTADQKTRIRQSATLLPISIPTIEMAGGSVRCMLAGVHLSQR
ncbi:citrulline utilization hydrolase CtlX [Anderseniella sp. Alg231-50]|uniref:citrulline utilization hydrolase CtlX n=1 Tax=Anderseniella sp. Alg231-50 TaxID=1922226 RepID=UPI000D54DAC0